MILFRTAVALSAIAPALWAQNNGVLSGRVLNSATSVGVEGVSLRACPAAGRQPRCGETNFRATTDAAGAFRIAVPQGDYAFVEWQKAAFAPAFEGFPPVSVGAETRFDLQLTPFANIRGRVFDPDGKPAEGVAVAIGFGAPKITNAAGEFLVETVAPGCCQTLSATPKPQTAPSSDGTWTVTTYYPSVVDPSQAVGIEVRGRDLNFDLRLQRAWAQPLRGTVVDAEGKPAADARIEIVAAKSGPVSFIRGLPDYPPQPVQGARGFTASKDGTFTSPPVREGEWTVQASRLANRDIHTASARVTISSRGGEIPPLDLRLAASLEVAVTADWGDAPPASIAQGFSLATIVPIQSQTDLLLARRPISERDDPQQRFRVSGGRYFIWEGSTVGFGAQPGYYASAAMWNGQNVLGQIVELTGQASFKMVYKNDGGTLRGTVEKGGDALVVLMADDLPSGARVGYSGRCDKDGVFSIPDLPPGVYTAVAVQGFSVNPLRPDFVSALARDGKRVRIEARSTTSVELRRGL